MDVAVSDNYVQKGKQFNKLRFVLIKRKALAFFIRESFRKELLFLLVSTLHCCLLWKEKTMHVFMQFLCLYLVWSVILCLPGIQLWNAKCNKNKLCRLDRFSFSQPCRDVWIKVRSRERILAFSRTFQRSIPGTISRTFQGSIPGTILRIYENVPRIDPGNDLENVPWFCSLVPRPFPPTMFDHWQ